MLHKDFLMELTQRNFNDYKDVISFLNQHENVNLIQSSHSLEEKINRLACEIDFFDLRKTYLNRLEIHSIKSCIEKIIRLQQFSKTEPVDFFPIDLSDGAGGFEPFHQIIESLKKQSFLGYNLYHLPEIGIDTLIKLNEWAYYKGIHQDKNRDNFNHWQLYSGGVTRACSEIFSLFNANDIILIPTPTYGNLINLANQYLDICLIPTETHTAWKLSPERFEQALHSNNQNKPKVQQILLLVNPTNPTGMIYTQKEIDALAIVAKKYGCFIIEDIIHHDLELQGGIEQGYFQRSEARDKTITVFGPSKSFCAADFRLGITYTTHPKISQELKSRSLLTEFSTSKMLDLVAQSCYQISEENNKFLKQNKKEYYFRHKLLEVFMTTSKSTIVETEMKSLMKHIFLFFPEKVASFLNSENHYSFITKPDAGIFQLLSFAHWKNRKIGNFKIETSLDVWLILSCCGVLTVPDLAQGFIDDEHLSQRVGISLSILALLKIEKHQPQARNIIAHYMLGVAIERIRMIEALLA